MLLLVYCYSYSQQIIADFNNDKVKDTLNYKCFRIGEIKDIVEPTCKLTLELRNLNKVYHFDLPYVYYPVISNCGNGCISLYDNAKDTEYTQEYNYSKKYDNWILTIDETRYNYENGKVENNLPRDYLLGIDGRKYTIVREIQKRRGKGRLVK